MSTEAYPGGLTFTGAIRVVFADSRDDLDVIEKVGARLADRVEASLFRRFRPKRGDWAPHLDELRTMRAEIKRQLLDDKRRRKLR